MPQGIDPYIGLHFQDAVQAFGTQEELIVALRTGASGGNLRANPGVQILAEDGGMLHVKASLPGQRRLQEDPLVEHVVPTTRRLRVAVLIRLRDPGWNREIPGLEKGSRLGRILTATADQEAISVLAADPGVLAVEASRPAATPDCIKSMPCVQVPPVRVPPYNERGEKALVAIIDGGVDIAHAAFLTTAGKTRILALWDQTGTAGKTPQAADPRYTQNYGQYYSPADLDACIAGKSAPSWSAGEMYHGTHVASIAAGSEFTAADGSRFPGGVACEAGLIVVVPKIRAAPGDPESIGYSVAHVDALAFIKQTADTLKMPVAVNVSQGMNAGAHDGSSLLEWAFDEFSGGGREPGYVIVKSAGNEHTYDGHAEARVVPGAPPVDIEWQTASVLRSQDYLEFWFASADELEFTLQPPSGPAITVTRAAPSNQANLTGGLGTYYLTLERFHSDNGDGRLLVLARNNGNSPFTAAGQWKLTIHGVKVVTAGQIHGWIERDIQRAARFVTGGSAARDLSIPGTARTVVCVGASDSATPLTVQNFSSRGPSRDDRNKPELVAPGLGIQAAAAFTTNGLMGMDGTSMAAPHVTGAVALLLSRRHKLKQDQLNAAQIRAALGQVSSGFSGSWDPGKGYGRLDVKALLDVF